MTPGNAHRYAVFDEIASGGTASVHLGRVLGPLPRTVAVKKLHPEVARDEDAVSMLLDEARLVARISHPSVVPILDVVADGESLFLVMEYVHGVSLAALGAPPVPIACAIVCSVLHALHAAHEAVDEEGAPLGAVHRDVSPQNVLVGCDGVARLVDFGIAQARGRLQCTRDGSLKGKLAYMAPEQLRNRGASRATDVYAAAVMFWEALVGRRLFDGDGEAAVLEQVLLGFVEPPSAVGEVPVALDDVVLRGLERDPARRYATAREMAEAIEAVAPLAKTAEVAAWVESRAGDLLRARAERIRAIERGQGGSAAAARWLLEANGKRSIVRVPARRGAWLTAPVIALAAAAVTAYAVRNAPSVQSLQAMRPPVVVAVSTAAPEAPPAAAEPAPVSALIDIDDPALSPAPPAANLSGAKPRRPAPAAARPSCDPPFTRDALGRKIYKRECLR